VTSNPTAIRVELELIPDRDPPEGRLRTQTGDQLSFSGWLELIAALTQINSTGNPRSADRPATIGRREYPPSSTPR
jgi:hypothetical protein